MVRACACGAGEAASHGTFCMLYQGPHGVHATSLCSLQLQSQTDHTACSSWNRSAHALAQPDCMCGCSSCQTELVHCTRCSTAVASTAVASLLCRFRWSIKPRSSSSRHSNGVQRAAARRLTRRSSARRSAHCICTTGVSIKSA